jgi:hypothetical protein
MFTASESQLKRWRRNPNRVFACNRRCAFGIGLKVRNKDALRHLTVQEGAHKKVRNAVNNGFLVRPTTCERCGDKPGLDNLGRSRIHGHHRTYKRPLDVQWLCIACHRKITPALRGASSPAAKVTVRQVRQMRAAYAKGQTGYQIWHRYPMLSKMAVYDIITRQSWRNI